jgi:hypothetical protein
MQVGAWQVTLTGMAALDPVDPGPGVPEKPEPPAWWALFVDISEAQADEQPRSGPTADDELAPPDPPDEPA